MALWLFWLMYAFFLENSSPAVTNTAAPARTNPIAMAQEVVPETVTAQSLIDDVTQFVNTNHSGPDHNRCEEERGAHDHPSYCYAVQPPRGICEQDAPGGAA